MGMTTLIHIVRKWHILIIIVLLGLIATTTVQWKFIGIKQFLMFNSIVTNKHLMVFYTALLLLLIIVWVCKKELLEQLKYVYRQTACLPLGLRISLPVIVLGQLLCLFIKNEVYPFTDVGMFRNRTVSREYPNKVATVKHYFYDKDSVVVIADIQGDRYKFNREFPLVNVPPRESYLQL